MSKVGPSVAVVDCPGKAELRAGRLGYVTEERGDMLEVEGLGDWLEV